jgi:signal peptidase I
LTTQSTGAEEEAAPRRDTGGGRALRFARDVAVIVLAAILISFLIKTFLVRSFYIPSPSMEDTLLVNDRILVNELVPGVVGIEHGDVVVFKDPGGWLPPQQAAAPGPIEWLLEVVGLTAPDSNDHLVKRVIGLPGDRVACCDDFGHLMVNGVSVNEPYITLSNGTIAASAVEFDVVVPEGHLWVMGDNRNNSRDSRYHRDQPGNGFVPIDDVVGRAVLVTWPLDRWQWIDNHSQVYEGVEHGDGPGPSPVSDG